MTVEKMFHRLLFNCTQQKPALLLKIFQPPYADRNVGTESAIIILFATCHTGRGKASSLIIAIT